MATLYEFANSSNWDELWTGQKVAEPVPNSVLDRFYPIPDFSVPILINNPVLAIYIESESDPGTWRRGGYLKQKISTGLSNGGTVDSYLTQKFLQLRKINIVQLQKIDGSFALEFAVPYWLREVSFTVWAYTGTVADTLTEQLNDLQNFIATCCDELRELSQVSSVEINNRITDAIALLNSSEVLLNSINEAVADGNGSNSNLDDEIISRLITMESSLNLLEDRTDSISSSLLGLENIPLQFEQLTTEVNENNDLVLTQINQVDAGLFTLASSLGQLLPQEQRTQLQNDISIRLDLNDDFLL